MVLFPSYVFARFSADQLYRVLSVTGVTSVVRHNGQPAAVSDEEILSIRLLAESLSVHGSEPQLEPLPDIGTRVRIIAGPLRGVTGIVSDYRSRGRVLVGLTAIGFGIRVDVEAAAVEDA